VYIRISLKHLLSLTSKSFQYILFQAFVYCLICRHELGRRWDTRLERSDTLTVLARATAVDRVCRHQLYICSPQWINTNPTTLLPRDIRHAIVSSLLCANSNPSFLEQFLCLWWVMTFSSAHIFLSGGLLHIGLIGWWPSTPVFCQSSSSICTVLILSPDVQSSSCLCCWTTVLVYIQVTSYRGWNIELLFLSFRWQRNASKTWISQS